MVITKFIEYLNKTKGYHIQTDYYNYIDTWKEWWQGYVPSFHKITETGANNSRVKRDLFTINMAKKVCEDWASLLFNDKTTLTVKDNKTAKWLLGNEDETGGILYDLRFWKNANELTELAFRSGTGAFVLSCENVSLVNGVIVPSEDARLVIDYNPAECILPITIKHGQVIDCAFASEVMVNGKTCIYLQTHTKMTRKEENTGKPYYTYHITNEYFEAKNDTTSPDDADFVKMALPDGMLASFDTGSEIAWFSLIKPNVVKNIKGGNGLGMAIYSNALDQLKHVDTAFNNYHRDLFLGGKKVFYNKRLLGEYITADGQIRTIAPDDVQQQLFWETNDRNPDAPDMWREYNPALRTNENTQAVQDALDYLSFMCGLGTHHYQFTNSGITTATEYVGNRQDMVQNANKHQINMETGLIQIIKAILYVGKAVCGADIDPDTSVTVNWDDSYITDADTRRSIDKADALDGFIPMYLYNMEWRGMSEEEAKKMVEEAQKEKETESGLNFGTDTELPPEDEEETDEEVDVEVGE